MTPEQKRQYNAEHHIAHFAKYRDRKNARSRAFYAAKKSADPDYNRGKHFKRRYSISTIEFDVLYAQQGGVCAICKDPNRHGTKGAVLDVDHCHNTGKVRGLLCNPCNTAIGRLGEVNLVSALEYVRGKNN